MSFRLLRYLAFAFSFAAFAYAQTSTQKACDAAGSFEKAKALLGQKLYEQATQALDQVHKCTGLSPLASFELGWLYGRARHFETALEVFATVPPNVPNPTTHAYAIALSQFELANYQGSITTLKALQAKDLLDENASNLLAVSFSKLGLYREAYAVLSAQLQKGPADVVSYLNLVTVCAEGGDFKSAAEVASRATELFPTSPEVFVVEGAANSLVGQLDEAYRDFSKGLQLAPDRPDIDFFLALTDYKEGKFTDAVVLLQGAIQQGVKDSDLHYLLAECLLKVDAANTDKALQQVNRALELNTNSIAARTLRGKLLLETGHPAEAIIDLELARQHDPDSRSATYNLARAYRAVGRGAEARAIFEQLRDQPSNTLGEMSNRRLNEALADKGKQQQ